MLLFAQMKPACDALCKYLEQAAQRDQQHEGKTKATMAEAKEKEKEAKKGEVATIGEHLLTVLRVNKGV